MCCTCCSVKAFAATLLLDAFANDAVLQPTQLIGMFKCSGMSGLVAPPTVDAASVEELANIAVPAST
jgi:hypothetical protein